MRVLLGVRKMVITEDKRNETIKNARQILNAMRQYYDMDSSLHKYGITKEAFQQFLNGNNTCIPFNALCGFANEMASMTYGPTIAYSKFGKYVEDKKIRQEKIQQEQKYFSKNTSVSKPTIQQDKKTIHGYWIHDKVEDPSAISGFFYKRECKCSECDYQVNMEKKVCPNCGAIMDQQPK